MPARRRVSSPWSTSARCRTLVRRRSPPGSASSRGRTPSACRRSRNMRTKPWRSQVSRQSWNRRTLCSQAAASPRSLSIAAPSSPIRSVASAVRTAASSPGSATACITSSTSRASAVSKRFPVVYRTLWTPRSVRASCTRRASRFVRTRTAMSASRRGRSPRRASPRRPASMSRATSAATARRMRSRACSTGIRPPSPPRTQRRRGASCRPPRVSGAAFRPSAARAGPKGTDS